MNCSARRLILSSIFAVSVLAVSQPVTGFAGALAQTTRSRAAQTNPTIIRFGRQNGNIRPFTVIIQADGTLESNGLSASTQTTHLRKDAVAGLVKLAKAEGFFSLPANITGTAVTPDTATIYVTVRAGSTNKTVHEHSARNSHFDQLFAVLEAVAGTNA